MHDAPQGCVKRAENFIPIFPVSKLRLPGNLTHTETELDPVRLPSRLSRAFPPARPGHCIWRQNRSCRKRAQYGSREPKYGYDQPTIIHRLRTDRRGRTGSSHVEETRHKGPQTVRFHSREMTPQTVKSTDAEHRPEGSAGSGKEKRGRRGCDCFPGLGFPLVTGLHTDERVPNRSLGSVYSTSQR